MPQNLLHWLAAMRLSNIGPIKFRGLLNHFPNIADIFTASHSQLQQAGLSGKDIATLLSPDWQSAEQDLIWCENNNVHIITQTNPLYPKLLLELPDAPLLLYVCGNANLLSEPQLAMVGSRNPTPTGRDLAEHFANCLSTAGLTITSGLALGIDAASHQGALKNSGKTIAVLGTGLKHIYPYSNKKLAERIIDEGALISEYHPDTAPVAHHFPKRNRIISGMSLGVLVIEAAIRSGSLITARLALEQGREVFAIPGSIHNPLARGCHVLIRQGAKLVEKAEDILEELGSLYAAQLPLLSPKKQSKLDANQLKLLAQIGHEVTALELIIHRSGLTAGEVSSMLLALELLNYVYVVPGGYVRSAP